MTTSYTAPTAADHAAARQALAPVEAAFDPTVDALERALMAYRRGVLVPVELEERVRRAIDAWRRNPADPYRAL